MIYKYLIPHTKEEINKIILSNTEPYTMGKGGYTDKFVSYINKNKVIIGKTPKSGKSHVTRFFCGVLNEAKHECYLKGLFMYPPQILIPQLVFFLLGVVFIGIVERNVLILPIACICYIFILSIWTLIHNAKSKSKHEIIDFITDKLNGTSI